MDRMYRMQRYFYDVTRKYYLLGRDQLLEQMEVRAGELVLEIGCRNGAKFDRFGTPASGRAFLWARRVGRDARNGGGEDRCSEG